MTLCCEGVQERWAMEKQLLCKWAERLGKRLKYDQFQICIESYNYFSGNGYRNGMTGYYQLTTSTLKCILEEKGPSVSLVATLIKRKDNCHQKVVSWLQVPLCRYPKLDFFLHSSCHSSFWRSRPSPALPTPLALGYLLLASWWVSSSSPATLGTATSRPPPGSTST